MSKQIVCINSAGFLEFWLLEVCLDFLLWRGSSVQLALRMSIVAAIVRQLKENGTTFLNLARDCVILGTKID